MKGNEMRLFTLWGAGLMMLVVGALHLINPQMMMNTPGVELSTVNHLHIIRAAYGGSYLGMACLFILGALGRIDRQFALVSVLILFSGFALGRLVSMALDGRPVSLYFGVLAAELFFAVCAVIAIKARKR
jgi:hypothetical protein